MTEHELRPWERQPGESAKAFSAFSLYLNQPPATRTILHAWHAYRPEQVHDKAAPGHFRKWAADMKWQERARAWDREKDRIAREAEAEADRKAIAEMRKRHIGLALSLQNAAANSLQKRLQLVEQGQGEVMTPYQIARFLREGTNLERLSRGEPTDIVKGDDALKQLADLLGVEQSDLVGVHKPKPTGEQK